MYIILYIFIFSAILVLWTVVEDFITYHNYKKRTDELLSKNYDSEKSNQEIVFLALRCFRYSQYSYFHKEQHKELLNRLQNHIKKTEGMKS